jgi:hypothetical protein
VALLGAAASKIEADLTAAAHQACRKMLKVEVIVGLYAVSASPECVSMKRSPIGVAITRTTQPASWASDNELAHARGGT